MCCIILFWIYIILIPQIAEFEAKCIIWKYRWTKWTDMILHGLAKVLIRILYCELMWNELKGQVINYWTSILCIELHSKNESYRTFRGIIIQRHWKVILLSVYLKKNSVIIFTEIQWKSYVFIYYILYICLSQ